MRTAPLDDAGSLPHRRRNGDHHARPDRIELSAARAEDAQSARRLKPGDHLQVHCSDPLAAIDIPNLIRESGDRIASVEYGRRGLVFLIEKAGGGAA